MLAISNSLNAHNLPIIQPILMIHVSKFMVHRALSDKIYLSLGLLSPLTLMQQSGGKYCMVPDTARSFNKQTPMGYLGDMVSLFCTQT